MDAAPGAVHPVGVAVIHAHANARGFPTVERTAVRVGAEDPALLERLDESFVEVAKHSLVARTVWQNPGCWEPLQGDVPRNYSDWLGLLVLDGLLVRHVSVGGLRCCELLGPGDVLRPWDEDDDAALIEASAAWRVLEPTRLALLDAGFARRAARWPSVSAEL